MTYNGWTNYETWAVKLWLDNDYGTYSYWGERVTEVVEETRDVRPSYFTHQEAARFQLADELKESHEEAADEALSDASVFTDLLRAAMSEVNWSEIAENMLDDVDDAEWESDDEQEEEVDA